MHNPTAARAFRALPVLALLIVASAPGAAADRIVLQVEDMDGPWRRQTNISGFIGKGFCTSNANPKIATAEK